MTAEPWTATAARSTRRRQYCVLLGENLSVSFINGITTVCSTSWQLIFLQLMVSILYFNLCIQVQATTTTTTTTRNNNINNDNDSAYYDPMILDPMNVYGSPYGGFSRATRKRLEKLPLRLPDHLIRSISHNNNNNNNNQENHQQTQQSQQQQHHEHHQHHQYHDDMPEQEYDENTIEDYNHYFETSNGFGQGYVCRTYTEDELILMDDKYSLRHDSMFDIPQFRPIVIVENEKDQSVGDRVSRAIVMATIATTKITAAIVEEEEEEEEEKIANEKGSSNQESNNNHHKVKQKRQKQQQEHDNEKITREEDHQKTITEKIIDEFAILEIERRLDLLEGICIQRKHPPSVGGYWTYEWCHEVAIRQFTYHYEVGSSRSSSSSSSSTTTTSSSPVIKLSHLSVLGYFDDQKRRIIMNSNNKKESGEMNDDTEGEVNDNDNDNDNDTGVLENEKDDNNGDDDDDDDDDDDELGQVQDLYMNGDICPETGMPRISVVTMFCCSVEETRNYNKGSTTFLNGIPIVNNDIETLIAIANIGENHVCNYEIEICTPLLCEEADVHEYADIMDRLRHDNDDGNDNDNDNNYHDENDHQSGITLTNVSTLSVMEVLDETIGGASLYSRKDSWWTYEYKHKNYIRQFHGGGQKSNTKPGVINLEDESQYILGYYNETLDNELIPSNEWQYAVNVTDELGITIHHASTRRGGNGAYFELEYIRGEMCIMEESTSSDDNSFQAIERASSVRFACDSEYSLTVREDSTCHYVVEVAVPALCEHPLFKAAQAKKRVIKCLPVDESEDDMI